MENVQQSGTTTATQQVIKVKQEKIDAEVEAKLKSLANGAKNENNADYVVEFDINGGRDKDDFSKKLELQFDDKKSILPVKSSNEILAELFGVFNVTPPEELLDDKSLLKKNNHKKLKRVKKKKHKKDKSNEECSESDSSVGGGRHKHRKKKKHKHKINNKSKEKKNGHKEKERSRGKVALKLREPTQKNSKQYRERSAKEYEGRTTESLLQTEEELIKRDRKRRTEDFDIEAKLLTKVSRRDFGTESDNKNRNSFYNGFDFENDSNKKCRYRPKTRTKDDKSDKKVDHISDISLSDEETYLREKQNERRHREFTEDSVISRNSNTFYGNSLRRTSEDRNNRKRETRRKQKSNSRSRSRTPIDKKRLFEIARKNAINMVKYGKMPGSINLSQEAKEKLLLSWRSGGRTVDDLTEFCRKISNGEASPEPSSDSLSDIDKNGNAKAFHHPFQLKEREPIVLHIRNSMPIVPAQKTENSVKAITMQFPVSSGQQHRMSETWTAIEKEEMLPPLPVLPPVNQSTKLFKDIQKNVDEKTIPATNLQEPAFKSVTSGITTTITNNVLKLHPSSSVVSQVFVNESEVNSVENQVPIVQFTAEVSLPLSEAINKNNSVFSEVVKPSVDVSSIITKRLNAIRRLQENPTDPEALKMMYSAQRDMSSWATSKHLPGQFTGSTGVNVLKAHELNSGPQLWARKDQLTSTKPVTGGMGMALLQKMGWKPGEGLGPSKSGSLQPLLLDIKLDKRGLVSREDSCQQPRAPMIRKQRSNNVSTLLNVQNKHPVCVLNELTSKNKWTPPHYTLLSVSGPIHSRAFLFSVEINGKVYTPPQASPTKKEAKLMAAKICLQQLGVLPNS